jgi:hypothetical protein
MAGKGSQEERYYVSHNCSHSDDLIYQILRMSVLTL